MAQKKVRFTVIDALIIIFVIAAGAFAVFKFMPARMSSQGGKTKAVFTVMISQKEKDFADAISIGDTVSISNKEKDTGTVVAVESQPAESLQFNSIDGDYKMQTSPDKYDVFVTIEGEASEDEKLVSVGTTPVKVGLEMPVRGKGYASMGFVVGLDTDGGADR